MVSKHAVGSAMQPHKPTVYLIMKLPFLIRREETRVPLRKYLPQTKNRLRDILSLLIFIIRSLFDGFLCH